MMKTGRRVGAIEAGGTKMVCVLGRESGEIEDSQSFATERPDVTIPKILQWFAERTLPESFGVGTFGPVELREGVDYGRILKTPKPGWEGFSWAEALHGAFGLPVAIATDVEVAALAEWRFGSAVGDRLVAYYTIGTGVGAGLLLDGKFLRGNAHSEMGHVTVPIPPEEMAFDGVCPFHQDCLEGRASGTAIRARWQKPGNELPGSHEAWELEATYLSAALQSLVATLSPDRIVFGGGVSQQDGLMERIADHLHERCRGYFVNIKSQADARELVRPAKLGQKAGAVGSLLLAASVLP